jgi:glycosyltransferase involved in cell wall biosynthesis
MNILHITPHLGGGVGTVIMGWMENVDSDFTTYHAILCLDSINGKARNTLARLRVPIFNDFEPALERADIVLCHYWGHPMLAEFLSKPLPDCRLVFWHHQNLPVPQNIKDYPDLFIGTSPIQGYERSIWSTGGVSRFLDVKPTPHRGFNIGYVGWVDYRKLHKDFIPMCHEIKKRIPEARFIIAGEVKIPIEGLGPEFQFLGHTDDVAGVLAQCDVFGYPLRPDHFGTCEQVLGEAMAAGVVPVCMDNPAEALITGANSGVSCVDRICALYENTYMGRQLPNLCRQRAADLYSIDKMIKAWDEVFQEMMTQPKRSHT